VSAGGLLLLGYFGMFSIGLPLVAAGFLALYGVIRMLTQGFRTGTSTKAAAGMAAGGAVAAVVVLLAGFSLTELAIRCPAHGMIGGGGPSFFGCNYWYSCDNGKLTISR